MFSAYGDESAGTSFVAYGAVLFANDRIADAEAILEGVKVSSGASAHDTLHCRELFHPDARKKTAWKEASIDDIFEIYSCLLATLAPVTVRTVVALGRIAEFPTEIPGAQWEHADPSFIGPMPWAEGFKFSKKNIASFGAQAIGTVLSRWPGFDRVELWPDPDDSMLEFQDGRRRFNQMLSCFVLDADPAKNADGKISVRFEKVGKPALLQVADVIAYVAQRQAVKGKSPNDRRFAKLWKQIDAEVVRLCVSPDGGLAINVPNSVRDFNPELAR